MKMTPPRPSGTGHEAFPSSPTQAAPPVAGDSRSIRSCHFRRSTTDTKRFGFPGRGRPEVGRISHPEFHAEFGSIHLHRGVTPSVEGGGSHDGYSKELLWKRKSLREARVTSMCCFAQ